MATFDNRPVSVVEYCNGGGHVEGGGASYVSFIHEYVALYDEVVG